MKSIHKKKILILVATLFVFILAGIYALIYKPIFAEASGDDSICQKNIYLEEAEYVSIPSNTNTSCNVYAFADAIIGIDYDEQLGVDFVALWRITNDGIVMRGNLGGFTLPMLEALQSISHTKKFIMQDVPGSYDDEALSPAIMRVRDLGYDTFVPSDGIISSGGVDFFAGGVNREAHQNARVGVHSWAEGFDEGGKTAKDYPKNAKEHALFLKLYKYLEIPEDFYWFTINQAPADVMYWMTPAEVKKYLLS